MEEAFEQMKKDGRNDVDKLVQWIKESKIIDDSKEAEENTIKLFEDVNNKTDVELEKFQQVVARLAADNKVAAEDLTQRLVAAVPRVREALCAAACAFKEALASNK